MTFSVYPEHSWFSFVLRAARFNLAVGCHQAFITSHDFMPQPDEAEVKANVEAICQKLLEAGWLKEFFFHDVRGLLGVKWTPKGLERAKWVNLIGDELNLGPKGLTALLVICHQYAPHE